MEQWIKTPIFWVLIIVLLILQSTWLFIDSRKRGKLFWFWGLWGLTQFPTPLLVYIIFNRKQWFRKRRNDKGGKNGG